ncbi:MAG: carbohydrate-binding protein, partial [Candidatus Hydrogenedentes bacterium]|nr:carbohydrate-binding protein [Candidatus Hydrogenedentota bacterium]
YLYSGLTNCGQPADVNSDGGVNAVDVQVVINDALGLDTGYNSDINRDGNVNAVDVQLVINAALGLI